MSGPKGQINGRFYLPAQSGFKGTLKATGKLGSDESSTDP